MGSAIKSTWNNLCCVCNQPLPSTPAADLVEGTDVFHLLPCCFSCQIKSVKPPAGYSNKLGSKISKITDRYLQYYSIDENMVLGRWEQIPQKYLGLEARDFLGLVSASGPLKIVSGGQTGADIAALVVASKLGIPTGGFAPLGYRTEKGNKPEILKAYGLQETSSEAYPERTELNIQYSDATLIFAKNQSSPGTVSAQRFADKHNKPIRILDPWNEYATVRAANFLAEFKIEVLNVGGNRESSFSGIGRQVLICLSKALRINKNNS